MSADMLGHSLFKISGRPPKATRTGSLPPTGAAFLSLLGYFTTLLYYNTLLPMVIGMGS